MLRKIILLAIFVIFIIAAFYVTINKKENDFFSNKINSKTIYLKTLGENFASNTATFIFTENIDADTEAKRLGLDMPWSDFEPTGIYAVPNEILTLNVEKIGGENLPELLIGTYSRNDAKGDPTKVELVEGVNSIQVDKFGGLVYVKFTSEKPNVKNKIKIDFTSGYKHVPFYIKGVTTQEDWLMQLEKYNNVPNVTLVSNRAIQVYSYKAAIGWKGQNIENILNTVDDVIEIENKISGMEEGNRKHFPSRNKILMTETDMKTEYMFATNFRTAYQPSGMKAAFTDVLRSDGWGAWHELGHMHQQTAWTWEEVDEVTVNIYSLAVEKAFGVPKRLEEENVIKKGAAFRESEDPNKNFNDESVDVFTRLYMFYQLGQIGGEDFYPKLHKITRQENPKLETREEKMEYFMVKASIISGYDLSDFFHRWGFVGVDDAYEKIKNLNLPEPAHI